MKRIGFLFISAVIGSAAGCAATVSSEPAYVARPAPTYHPRDRERRIESRWMTLADGYSAQAEKQTIKLGPAFGQLSKIRVEAVRGEPAIYQIAIEYADQHTQVVPINARFAPGEGQVIDLDGRRTGVNRIVVYTTPSRGSYSVFGT